MRLIASATRFHFEGLAQVARWVRRLRRLRARLVLSDITYKVLRYVTSQSAAKLEGDMHVWASSTPASWVVASATVAFTGLAARCAASSTGTPMFVGPKSSTLAMATMTSPSGTALATRSARKPRLTAQCASRCRRSSLHRRRREPRQRRRLEHQGPRGRRRTRERAMQQQRGLRAWLRQRAQQRQRARRRR